MTTDEAQTRALLSLLDVVDELASGLAAGQTPEPDWSQLVADTFAKHGAELRHPEVHEL